jgi:hypothetical protein
MFDIFLKRHEKNVIDQQVSCSGERNKVRNYFGERVTGGFEDRSNRPDLYEKPG